MADPQPRKTSIAVLGGGIGSISAAYWLTSTPELRDTYDVTVYQLGWRLGGKCASGRNQERFDRIQEHGLHVWFGFYENAFKTMRQCYEELGRPPDAPLATWQDAFKPCSWFVLNELWQGEWRDWPLEFPTNPVIPGDGGVLPSFWDMAYECLDALWDLLSQRVDADAGIFAGGAGGSADPSGRYPWWDRLVDDLGVRFAHDGSAAELKLLQLALRLAEGRSKGRGPEPDDEHYGVLCRLLTDVKDWLWKDVVSERLDDAELRKVFELMDLGGTIICGVIADDLIERGFHAVDDEELRAWLARHGARQVPTLGTREACYLDSCPLLRACYDVAFAFEEGDVCRPNLAAGVALEGILRMTFTYKGAIFWKMQAGMGDTVLTPFYQVLKRRGVRFEYFRAVTGLGLSEDGSSVETVEVVPQVDLVVEDYAPLIEVKDLACWPSEPRWEQLKDGARLAKEGVDFEHALNPLGREPIRLRRGEDFDDVILGISLAGLPPITEELSAASPDWCDMLTHVKTVMTQAFQLWMNEDTQALGWSFSPHSIMGSYVEPMDTYADMSHLIPREDWPESYGVRSIAYMCGPLKDEEGDTQKKADARALESAKAYLQGDTAHVWPASRSGKDGGFAWRLLVDEEPRKGESRILGQYWRANFQPTERYVLSLAGTTRYRLAAGDSGFDNLYLAGDWVLTGLNVGHVEATVMSGMQASRAICGVPETVIGEEDRWIRPSDPPAAEGAS